MNRFKPDGPASQQIFAKLDSVFASSGTSAAEKLVVDALHIHPGLMFIYRGLSDVYLRLGDEFTAKRCARGILPLETLERTCPTYIEEFPGEGVADERIYVHQPDKVHLPDPITLDDKLPVRFTASKIESDTSFVDRCVDGSVWFDGFNRVLFNSQEESVAGHSRGGLELISAFSRQYSPLHVDGRVFLIGNRGAGNFYHWMLDILPSLDCFKQAGFSFRRSDRFILHTASSSFQKQSLLRAGIDPQQIIELENETPYVSAKEIICPHFQNAMGMRMGRWIPEFLKQFWLSGQSHNSVEENKTATIGRRIWLARANNARNGRCITNNDELIDFFARRGFEVVYPETLSVEAQARLFSEASVVAGVHGAGLANIAFCKPGTTVLELYGAHLAPCYWAISALCGLRYANLYCDGESDRDESLTDDLDRSKLRTMDISVDLARVSATLDLIESGSECVA